MFFLNTVNGFFNQFVVGHSEWMGAIGLVASIPGIIFLFSGQTEENLR